MLLSPKIMVPAAMAVFLAASFALSMADHQGQEKYKEWRFVRDVVLKSEYGPRRNKVLRWIRSPKVIYVSDQEANEVIFEEVLSELNQSLDGTGIRMERVPDTSQEFDILVAIADPARHPEIMRKTDCRFPGKTPGFVCVRLHEDGSFWLALVLMSAKETPEDIRITLLEEMFQVLGPTNDSPIFYDSVVYETKDIDSTDDFRPFRTKLSRRDKKLLRFLYIHLKPGDGEEEVRKAFDQHWDRMEVR